MTAPEDNLDVEVEAEVDMTCSLARRKVQGDEGRESRIKRVCFAYQRVARRFESDEESVPVQVT